MRTSWQSRDTDLTLPAQTLRAMWERARRSFDVTEGGRFDARSRSTMLIWSSPLTDPGAEPLGAFSVRWNSPSEDAATIHLVAWAAGRGGSEAQVWRAIKVLAGRDWPVARRASARNRPVRDAA